MESTATTAPVDKERRKSLTKIFGRVKTAFRRGSRTSLSGPSGAPTESTPAGKKETQVSSSAPPQSKEPSTISEEPTNTEPEIMVPSNEPAIMEVDTMYFNDRAAALLAKYNLDIVYEPRRLKGEPQERVAKAIKMRVRYTCHHCSTSFGHDKECISCHHRRCTKCNRYPPKRTKEQRAAKTAVKTAAKTAATESQAAPVEPATTTDRPCPCHMCQTDILIEVEECPNCHHRICDECLKEAKLEVSRPQPADSAKATETQSGTPLEVEGTTSPS